ncbi:RhoGAP domain protein [Onchocerca flexuosa]|uniref:RhoGAP domain protein n=2 Tax=Onchocerca flexuosa TaxID=387005 RepID=A0A238BWR3_9BILA|nr:RhoGAP domain protein [Onchocerca flexuosa]
MDKVVCSGRSREILKEYSANNSFAMTLIEEQNRIDILKVLDLLEQMRQNWNYEKMRVEVMEEKLNQKNKEKDGLRKEIRIYKEQLRDARTQIASLMSNKESMEHDIMEWEKKFELVSDLLKDQSHLSIEDRERLFASGNILNKGATTQRKTRICSSFLHDSSVGENIDCDKTTDTFDISSDEMNESRLRNGKVYRRSRSMISLAVNRVSAIANKRPKKSMLIDPVEEEVETPCKRSKNGTETQITAITKVIAEHKKSPAAEIAIGSSMNRSLSSTSILDKSKETVTLQTNMLTPRCGTSSVDLRTPVSGGKTWTRGASISTHPHTYINHNSILGDHCEVCSGWIGIVGKQAYKCCDCGLHVHKACIDNAPMPCVPRTPASRTPSKQRPRLKDLCPPTQPMIPPILIHCILALEKNRLCSEGIYRIPGDDIQVQKLLNEFQNGRSIPKLDYHDTETITSCIKQFLIKLRDPVIPSTSWEEFVNAAETDDIITLNNGIMDLPYPNRDTLAFLCAHFQKICNNCIQNKMPPNVLARCVAAVIIGPAPPHVLKTDEEAKQVMVMLALLRMPPDYWPKFYNFDNGIPLINSPKCKSYDNKKPVKTPYKNPNKSILGPVETPPSGQEANTYRPKISGRKHFLGDIF